MTDSRQDVNGCLVNFTRAEAPDSRGDASERHEGIIFYAKWVEIVSPLFPCRRVCGFRAFLRGANGEAFSKKAAPRGEITRQKNRGEIKNGFLRCSGRPCPMNAPAPHGSPKRCATSAVRGQLRFSNAERDGQQLFCVARDGLYLWPPETPQAVASASYVPAVAPSFALTTPILASRRGAARRPAAAEAADAAPSERKSPDFPLPDPPDAHLLEALRVLAARSAPSRPLEILSLFRPPYRTAYWRHGGPGTLHSHGMAVDIAAYGGYKIAQNDPESCVRMTLALLRDLPPGKYRMGLPKAPDTPLVPGRPFLPPSLYALVYGQGEAMSASGSRSSLPSRRGKVRRGASLPAAILPSDFALLPAALGIMAGSSPTTWPFFPAPQPEIKDGVIAESALGSSRARIVRFQNEAYAPPETLADARLRDALKGAAKRGVVVVGLFPDGADHIHLDVKPKR